MLVDSAFKIGDFVYLKTDTEQLKRIVTGMIIRPTGVSYELVCGETYTSHFEFELSNEKDVLIATSN